MKLFLPVCVRLMIEWHPWFCVMVIDAGEVFERNGIEPFFDEIPVHVVDDSCSLFCVSAGNIKFRKADDLKAIFSGGGIQDLTGLSISVRRIGVGG